MGIKDIPKTLDELKAWADVRLTFTLIWDYLFVFLRFVLSVCIVVCLFVCCASDVANAVGCVNRTNGMGGVPEKGHVAPEYVTCALWVLSQKK